MDFTRENLRKILPVLQAWAEGKTIQVRLPRDEWDDVTVETLKFDGRPEDYRIKPEPREWFLLIHDNAVIGTFSTKDAINRYCERHTGYANSEIVKVFEE